MPQLFKSSKPTLDLKSSAWVVVVVLVVIWFLTLGYRHLIPSDEGRYAEIAREMFATGDWVTIRYNGLKYFEKPPLQLWATALAYTVFGVGDWQARLWVGLSGAAGLAMTVLAAARWYGKRAAALTGFALLGTPAWVIAGHFNSLDMGVTFALATVLSCLLIAQHPEQTPSARRWWMWGAWTAVGAAILTKGLIGLVLPGLVVAAYLFVTGETMFWKRLHIASGIALMLALAAPWFALVSIANPEFAHFFFIHEHWQRYTSDIHKRTGPWWYFIPQLAMGFLPWLGLLPRMLANIWNEPKATTFRPGLFLGLWVAVIFLFFSLSGSKLPGYIIPVYPALAVLAGAALNSFGKQAWARQAYGLLLIATVGFLATPFVARFGHDPATRAAFHDYAPWLAGACGSAIVCLGIGLRLNRNHTGLSIIACSIAFFLLVTLALLGHESFGRTSSGFALAREARRVIGPDMPLYSVERLDHTVPFYMRHTTELVAWQDELAFGIQQEPTRWVPTLEDFARLWVLPVHAGALMSKDTYAKLQQLGVVMYPVTQDERRVVVVNFAH